MRQQPICDRIRRGARASPARRAHAPASLAEFVGQNLFWAGAAAPSPIDGRHYAFDGALGSAGSGKTTLARLAASRTSPSSSRSPRSSRESRTSARRRERAVGARGGRAATVLFLDEVHRFNKAQQDTFRRSLRRHAGLHRRDHGEPVVRAELGAPVACARLRAESLVAVGTEAADRAGAGGSGARRGASGTAIDPDALTAAEAADGEHAAP